MIKENKDELITAGAIANKVKFSFGNGRGTFVLAIIGIAISLASSFTFCLASIGFDFTQLAETTFWSRWASMAISAIFAFALVILHKDEVNRLNEWYVENLKLLADKSATAGDDFELYLQEFNLQRRIIWHKRNINEKLGKLNKRLLKWQLKDKPTGKIEEKIKKYKELITDEYIEANKYSLKTRSKPISSVQVLSEAQRGDNGEANFRSATAYYGGRVLLKLCFSLCLTAAFACVVVNSFTVGVNVAAIAMTILTLLSLLISVVSAIMVANGCYKNVYVPNLQFKLKILSGFENWKANKN